MRWLATLLICSTAATCGQKGPLRLPDDPQAVAAERVGAAPDPVALVRHAV